MPIFAVMLEYGASPERIAEVRPEHRAYLAGLLEAGKLVQAGKFADDSGGLLIYETEDYAAAQEILANDPFSMKGVVTGASIKEWSIVLDRNQP